MKTVLRFLSVAIALVLLRRAGVSFTVGPVSSSSPAAPRPTSLDATQIVNLMIADPSIGLVIQANEPGEPLRGVRMTGPGGRA